MPPRGQGGGGGGGADQGVVGGLKSVYSQIADLTLAPDAGQHQQFLQALMNGVRQYLTAQTQQAMGAGGPGGQGGQGGPGGPPPGMGGPAGPGTPPPQVGPGQSLGAPGLGGAPPPGMGGPMQGPPGAANINPDELRRVLSGGVNAGSVM